MIRPVNHHSLVTWRREAVKKAYPNTWDVICVMWERERDIQIYIYIFGGLNERLEHGNKSVWHWWTIGRNMENKNMEKQWDFHIISHHDDAEKDMGKSQEKKHGIVTIIIDTGRCPLASVLDLRIKPLEWCLQRKKGCWSSSIFFKTPQKTCLRLPARWEKTGERGLAPPFWILVTGYEYV